MKNPIRVLSLFSGCGGMDLGIQGGFRVLKESINRKVDSKINIDDDTYENFVKLSTTVFRNVFANDILPYAKTVWVNYFSKNSKNSELYKLESIVDLVKRYRQGEYELFPEAEIVTGGFPCQDFSIAGKRKGFNSHKSHYGILRNDIDDPTEENRGKLYYWMRNVIEIVKPKMFIAENVKGLVLFDNVREIIERDFSSIGKNGYTVISKVLNAANFGVPQSRERVIFLGFNNSFLRKKIIKYYQSKNIPDDISPFPLETHQKTPDHIKKQYVSVRQALINLVEPEKSDDLSQQSYSKAKWYGKHVQGQTEINLDYLGPTIRAEHHGNIEFRRLSLAHGGKILDELEAGMKERRLTVRECARIQTFPDDFNFVTRAAQESESVSPSDAYRLIGNAVPPLLAYHLGYRLQEIWDELFIV